MTIAAERIWLMVAIELARMQLAIRATKIQGPGTSKLG